MCACLWAAHAKRPWYAPLALATLLAGCQVHPLPSGENDKIFPVYEIIHRIQCEAAVTVRALYLERNFPAKAKNLKEFDTTTDERINTLKAKIKPLETSDFGTRREELADAYAALELQLLQIKQARARIAASSQATEEKDSANAALDAENGRIARQIANYTAASKALDDKPGAEKEMDDLRKERRKKFGDLIDFNNNSAVFQFEFEVTEDNNATSTGSFIWPVVLGGLPGSFTMGYDVGDKRQRQAKRTVKLASTFDELALSYENSGNGHNNGDSHRLDCRNASLPAPDPLPRTYPITGNIGLDGVFREYIEMLKSGKFKSGGESYMDKIQFTTTVNGGLKPAIDLARKPGPTIKASADINASRKDLHILSVFLTPPDGSDKAGDKAGGAQELAITRMPAVRIRGDIVRLPPLN
jgi:hypothetical protein